MLDNVRTSQDLATQVHHWDAFRLRCREKGMTKRDIDCLRFIPPTVAEFMAGCWVALLNNSGDWQTDCHFVFFQSYFCMSMPQLV